MRNLPAPKVLAPRLTGSLNAETAAAVVASTIGIPSLTLVESSNALGAEVGPLNDNQRANKAYQFRHKAALDEMNLSLPTQPDNGDEERYPKRIGNYSKGLPHNALGEVDLSAYNALLHAMATGAPSDFDAVALGGSLKQTNPQSALAFELDAADSHHLACPAPPAFASEDEAEHLRNRLAVCSCFRSRHVVSIPNILSMRMLPPRGAGCAPRD